VAAIVSIVETCLRLKIPVRDQLGSVLPGLSDFPINRIAEITPSAWTANAATQTRRRLEAYTPLARQLLCRGQPATFDFSAFQAVVYLYRRLPVRSPTDPKSSPMSPRPTAKSFTPKQGQYLAFIYAYTRVVGRPPAEADMQRHFRVSPPSVHQMVLTLERAGLVRRQPGVARSIEVLVAPELLPVLR